MLIKMLDGPSAGKVRDIDNGTALELLKQSRATRAFGEPGTPAVHAQGAAKKAAAKKQDAR